ncbi:hypothetical protein R83H12_00589 [Fibrobacteria bacterium R8-3-H12]
MLIPVAKIKPKEKSSKNLTFIAKNLEFFSILPTMKAICLFSLCIFASAALFVSCGGVRDDFNTDNLSSSDNNGALSNGALSNSSSSKGSTLSSSADNGSLSNSSSSKGNTYISSNWKIEKAEKVSFQYIPETGNYNLVFQDMKIEDVAIASLFSENTCGIRYGHGSCTGSNYDKVEFFVNGKLHNDEVINSNYCIFSVPVREYSESLPCGSYTFTWKITKRNKDGIPDAIVSDISKRPIKDTAYAPEFSFEAGWASDLDAKNWYLNNRDKYQGSYSLNAGWMKDEETKEIRINLPDTATKLNLYYKFSNTSTKYKDAAYIIIDDHQWNLDNYSWSKFSVTLRPQDTVAIIKFVKREDGFSSFFVDDIRTLRYAPAAQTNGLWDFEEGFYPIEISEDWWIDNFEAYKGEYSLRAPLNADGICGFDIDVGQADSVSFWSKCSYSGIYAPKIRIGSSEDYIACNCSSSWNECKIPTYGQMPLHIETDCVSGYNRRIDYIKAW